MVFLLFYCFLTNIFQITFKCLQNIVRLFFHLVKFSSEKYNMLRAHEDGRMLFLHKANHWDTSSNANGIEKPDNF